MLQEVVGNTFSDPQLIQLYCDHGANPNEQDGFGFTPLMSLILNIEIGEPLQKFLEKAKLLIKKGALLMHKSQEGLWKGYLCAHILKDNIDEYSKSPVQERLEAYKLLRRTIIKAVKKRNKFIGLQIPKCLLADLHSIILSYYDKDYEALEMEKTGKSIKSKL